MDIAAADRAIQREADSGGSLAGTFKGLMAHGHRAMGSPGERRAQEAAGTLLRSWELDTAFQEIDVKTYRRGSARAVVSAGGESAELPCLAFLYCPPTSSPLTLDLVAAGMGNPEDIERLGGALRGKAAYARPADIMRSARNRNLTAAGAAACLFGSHADTHDACIISYVRKDISAPVPVLGLSRSGSALLEGFLARGNARVAVEVSGDTVPSRSGNLVATLPGRSSLPEIVVGGHFDTYDLCEGALDNGAGAALILETARIFSNLPRPLRKIRFALFTGEEVSNTGSRHWVAEALRDPGQVGLFMNVDMPVEGGVPGILTGLGTGDGEIWDRMGKDLGCRIPVRPADDRFSDHVSFAERGVPCFWLRAQSPGSRGPSRIEHTTLDTADRVDLGELREATLLAARVLLRFAESDTLPFASAAPSIRIPAGGAVES